MLGGEWVKKTWVRKTTKNREIWEIRKQSRNQNLNWNLESNNSKGKQHHRNSGDNHSYVAPSLFCFFLAHLEIL